jgi:hypothetical protein
LETPVDNFVIGNLSSADGKRNFHDLQSCWVQWETPALKITRKVESLPEKLSPKQAKARGKNHA